MQQQSDVGPVRSAPMVNREVSDADRARIAQQAPPRPTSLRATSGKASAVVTSAQLARGRNAFERVVGMGLLIGSVAGSVLAFNGGVTWPVTPAAALGGIGIQVLITVIQWFYHPHVPRGLGRFTRLAMWLRGLTWKYVASVLLGAGLSAAGYRTILWEPLAAVAGRAVDPTIGALILLVVVSLFMEVIPENILVD